MRTHVSLTYTAAGHAQHLCAASKILLGPGTNRFSIPIEVGAYPGRSGPTGDGSKGIDGEG